MSFSCEHVRELLSAYFDDELPHEEARSVDLHLASCDSCRDELAKLRELSSDVHAIYAKELASAPPKPTAPLAATPRSAEATVGIVADDPAREAPAPRPLLTLRRVLLVGVAAAVLAFVARQFQSAPAEANPLPQVAARAREVLDRDQVHLRTSTDEGDLFFSYESSTGRTSWRASGGVGELDDVLLAGGHDGESTWLYFPVRGVYVRAGKPGETFPSGSGATWPQASGPKARDYLRGIADGELEQSATAGTKPTGEIHVLPAEHRWWSEATIHLDDGELDFAFTRTQDGTTTRLRTVAAADSPTSTFARDAIVPRGTPELGEDFELPGANELTSILRQIDPTYVEQLFEALEALGYVE